MILGSTGETGGKCFASHQLRKVPNLYLLCLHHSLFLSHFCSFLYLQTPAPPPTSPPAAIKGIQSKTKTPTHPHRVVRCLRLDAEVRVQHLIPSELLQVFVDSQGLEVCIWIVFIIS